METEEEVHRQSLRKVLDDFRKSMKDEFADLLEKSESEPSSSRVSEPSLVAKPGTTKQRNGKARSPSKRGTGKHRQSVLIDPSVISLLRPVTNDGPTVETKPKLSVLKSKVEPSSLSYEASKTCNVPVTSQSPTTTNNVPVTSQSPTITNNVPVTRQSPTTTNNVPVTSHSPTTTNNVPVTRQSPTTTNNVPVTRQSPTTTNNVPVTTSQSPTTTNNVPVTTSQSPTATNNASVTRPSPIPTNNVPVTTSQSPTATNNVPLTTSRSPTATNNVPVTTSQSPTATNNVPVTTSRSPTATNSVPVTTSQSPTTTNNVHVTSQSPTATNNASVTSQSPTVTNNASVTSQSPTASTNASVTRQSPTATNNASVTRQSPTATSDQLGDIMITSISMNGQQNLHDITVGTFPVKNVPDRHLQDVSLSEKYKFAKRPLINVQDNVALRLQDNDALRLQDNDAFRLQDNDAFRLQDNDALRLQDNDASRLQANDALRLQDNDALRLQVNDALRLQDNDAIRLQDNVALRLQDKDALQDKTSEDESILSHSDQTMSSLSHLSDIDSEEAYPRMCCPNERCRTYQRRNGSTSSSTEYETDTCQRCDKQTQCGFVHVEENMHGHADKHSYVHDYLWLRDVGLDINMTDRESCTSCEITVLTSSDRNVTNSRTYCKCGKQYSHSHKRHVVGSYHEVKNARCRTFTAQAQAKADQKKNSDVHMKFDKDGLHIQSNNGENGFQPDQRMLMPPQLPQVPASFHQGTPLYDNYDANYDAVVVNDGYEGYSGDTSHNNYITNLPEYTGHDPSAHARREPPDGRVYDSYSTNNDSNVLTNDSSLGPHKSSKDNRNTDVHDVPPHPDGTNRRRRLGRDHTNYVLPPNLDFFKDKKIKYEKFNDESGISDGPPGLHLNAIDNSYSEETGLKLVVVDDTDDEDGNSVLGSYDIGTNTRLFKDGYPPRPNGDVFPIDKKAIDRDLYKQVYDPTAEAGRPKNNPKYNPRKTLNNNPNKVTNNGLPAVTNNKIITSRSDNSSRRHQHQYDTKDEDTSRPGFVYHVTDYDSEPATNTGRISSDGSQSFTPRHKFPSISGSTPNLATTSYDHPPQMYERHNNESVRGNSTSNPSQQMYSLSKVDYDRYTNNASQLSTVRDDIDRRASGKLSASNKPHTGYSDVDSRTSSVNSSHFINDTRQQDAKTLAPGYKFQVNKYNVAKRASILTRAEQLIDARRGQEEMTVSHRRHFTDRSDSSDELERIDEDDNEDSDLVDDMSGPRHRALIHLQRRVYDDSTSYNSSDDVLHNMRYHPRGPVTQAARRARLTSVNARLKKQKRMRISRKQILPPPPLTSNDESSSGSDSTDRTISNRQQNEGSRYKESNLPALSGEGIRDNQQHVLHGDASPGPKGRRVLFFRNGDIHYKPKQVLISNKTYTNLEKLLVDLSSMVETSTGVKYVFSWPEGREVKSITEFENGKYYVCSSTSRLQRVDYGNSKENHWKVGKIDRKENALFQPNDNSKLQAAKVQPPLRRPRVLTVISNLYRDSREKLILNTNSQMNFEDIFTDISNMINIANPPVKALYTEKKPHQKVESYSQLIRDFNDHENFIACGEELVPVELSRRKSGRDSDIPVYLQRKGPYKGKAGGAGRYQDNKSVPATHSPNGSNDHIKDGEHGKGRRRRHDSVRVDINGKLREFFPPTHGNQNDGAMKPDKMLRLDWVYGYRGRDVKQNLSVLPSSGELVYFVAAVVVVYNKKFSSQRHYLGHSEEITCLAVHPNGRFIATGQVSGKTPETGAHVRIWDGVSLSTYAVIGLGTLQLGVTCISFLQKGLRNTNGVEATPGDLVMTIDDSDRHVLTVWEWQTEIMVARTSTTSEPVVSGSFYPFDENLLVTYGKEHVHFWRMFWDKNGKIMRDKLSGNFEGQLPKFVTSVCFAPNGDVVTGDTSGAILVWARDNNNVFAINRNTSAQTRKAHKKSVSALCMLGDGTLLSGGGNVVKAWDTVNNYALVKERVLPDTVGHVRTIMPMNSSGLDGSIYVATTRNKVLEGSLQFKFKVIIQGHVEELWAVESHPFEETFVSAGHDQSVVKWSAVSHAPVWKVNVETVLKQVNACFAWATSMENVRCPVAQTTSRPYCFTPKGRQCQYVWSRVGENPCTSISINPKGRLIALGTTSGRVVILNSSSGVHLTTLVSGTAQINALSFSPDGSQLAVGTFDGSIQIFQVQDEGHNFYRPQAAALKHNNMFIMHLDWSVDSRVIQAVLGDYEIVYWNVTTMQRIKSSRSVRDVKWATHNCPVGHSIIGPWQNLDRGDAINVVSQSQNRDLQAVGDTRGRLRLYKWPCSVPKAGYRQTKVYSSNVTCATFTCQDRFLITSGGNDAALMQFSVHNTTNTR